MLGQRELILGLDVTTINLRKLRIIRDRVILGALKASVVADGNSSAARLKDVDVEAVNAGRRGIIPVGGGNGRGSVGRLALDLG